MREVENNEREFYFSKQLESAQKSVTNNPRILGSSYAAEQSNLIDNRIINNEKEEIDLSKDEKEQVNPEKEEVKQSSKDILENKLRENCKDQELPEELLNDIVDKMQDMFSIIA